jgi:hypothetical protein
MRSAHLIGSCLLALCCASREELPAQPPVREPPALRTPDGEVMGAEGVPPAKRLRGSVRVGEPTELAPGWSEDDGALRRTPEMGRGGEPQPGIEREDE